MTTATKISQEYIVQFINAVNNNSIMEIAVSILSLFIFLIS